MWADASNNLMQWTLRAERQIVLTAFSSYWGPARDMREPWVV